MINQGNYKCDYCGDENGEFLTATGNHPICEENATLKEALRLARSALERVKPQVKGALVMQDVERAITALAQAETGP